MFDTTIDLHRERHKVQGLDEFRTQPLPYDEMDGRYRRMKLQEMGSICNNRIRLKGEREGQSPTFMSQAGAEGQGAQDFSTRALCQRKLLSRIMDSEHVPQADVSAPADDSDSWRPKAQEEAAAFGDSPPGTAGAVYGHEASPDFQDPALMELRFNHGVIEPGTPNARDMTTLMIRNLPPCLLRNPLEALINNEGFAGYFDFLYVPADIFREESFEYAFINLVSPRAARDFVAHFRSFDRWPCGSTRRASFEWSMKVQGFHALVEYYQDCPIMHHTMPEFAKPAIYCEGLRVPMPPPTRELAAPRVRRSTRNAARKPSRCGCLPAHAANTRGPAQKQPANETDRRGCVGASSAPPPADATMMPGHASGALENLDMRSMGVQRSLTEMRSPTACDIKPLRVECSQSLQGIEVKHADFVYYSF